MLTVRILYAFSKCSLAHWKQSNHGARKESRVHRFLRKVHRECFRSDKHTSEEESNKETLKVLHETILKVTEAIEDLRFNVAISQMMILINHLQKVESYSIDTAKTLLQLLAPFAPHLTEELWENIWRATIDC